MELLFGAAAAGGGGLFSYNRENYMFDKEGVWGLGLFLCNIGVILRNYWGYTGVILGLYWRYIRVILGHARLFL